ncbi:MAG: hypothetical protein R3272_13640 [Candidatus Promineifilaceae bacterium]|nr:hypothetical protein [Candidatus Promineifilaceae bacterium]
MTNQRPHRVGEARLRGALRRLRQAALGRNAYEHRRRPVNIEPSNTFEYSVISRLADLERDIAEMKARNEWLIRLVFGALVAAVMDLLLA